MKARPILMSAPMVQALLAGRKTQTRRAFKEQPSFLQIYRYKNKEVYDGEARQWCWHGKIWDNIFDFISNRLPMLAYCPYGKPGDLLWVRETWGIYQRGDSTPHGNPIDPAYVYRANNENYKPDIPDYAVIEPWRWRPSIHMPRRASRIALEITNIRVERLQDISHDDAATEGCIVGTASGRVFNNFTDLRLSPLLGVPCWKNCRDWYADLWESINGADSWDANPWVWVIEFKVHQQNVDEYLKARAA